MDRVWRLVLAMLIGTSLFTAFLVGIAQYPDPSRAPFLGVSAGWLSAFAWGCTAISFEPWLKELGIEGTNGLLNFVAAAFAALAVGYLAPAPTCSNATQAAVQSFVCSFYSPALQPH